MSRHTPADLARRSVVALVLAAALAMTVTGCGEQRPDTATPRAERSYGGPLVVADGEGAHPRAGAAGDVVDCTVWGEGGSAGPGTYAEGATAASPAAALETARSEHGFSGAHEGLRVAAQQRDRVLYVLEVGGVTKQAVVLHDGPATEGAGGPGWYVESWARCDWSELPVEVTDALGIQIWHRADGSPAPTTEIEARVGPEHCDWQSMVFLVLDDATYVRSPEPDLEDYVSGRYEEHATLPSDAASTGYERDGDRLWVAPDRRRAFVGRPDNVEVWPRASERLACD